MTTLLEAEQIVLNKWVTDWGTTTPFVFAEERQPSTISTGETEWSLVQVVDIAGEQETLNSPGLRRFIRRAVVSITIYVPSGRGVSRALILGEQARNIFEGVRLQGLRFFTGQTERLGSVPPEFLLLVTIPFDYEVTK